MTRSSYRLLAAGNWPDAGLPMRHFIESTNACLLESGYESHSTRTRGLEHVAAAAATLSRRNEGAFAAGSVAV